MKTSDELAEECLKAVTPVLKGQTPLAAATALTRALVALCDTVGIGVSVKLKPPKGK